MRLIIAEKPSLARKIADALGVKSKQNGSILLKDGSVVGWAQGHLFELVEPDEFVSAPPNPKTGKKPWRIEDLPIIPDKWRMKPIKGKGELIKNLRNLLKQASEVVNAGDPDREGQLLIDEILEEINYRGPVKRVWLKDLTVKGIQAAFNALKDNSEYAGLRDAARGRAHADWLIGMNATRAMTLKQRGRSVMSLGRVQTPTLNLIVQRELDIQNFKPRDFFEVYADFVSSNGQWRAKWQPNKDLLTEDGYLLDKKVAEQVVSDVTGQTGEVIKVERKRKKQAPPLPFSLSDLQKSMSNKGFDPSETLSVVQKLYEKGILTYPRTDCNYLEEGRHAEGATILPKLDSLLGLPKGWDVLIKSKAFDDKKVTAHTAIVPTESVEEAAGLTGKEKAIFDTVAKRYAAQFYPPYEYEETIIQTQVGEYLFSVKGQVPLEPGWKVLYGSEETDDQKTEDKALPPVTEGQSAKVDKAEVVSKRTQPPKRFTMGEMPTVMKNAARYAKITDPKQKAILKDTEGIGTEATRGSILDTLVKRNYVEVKGKKKEVMPTPMGMELMQVVPYSLKDVGTTAIWETALRSIEQGKMNLEDFERSLKTMTEAVVEEILSGAEMSSVEKRETYDEHEPEVIFSPCPLCKEGEIVATAKAYGCSRWKEGCQAKIWKNQAGHTITPEEAVALLEGKTIGPFKNLKGKSNKPFTAKMNLDIGKIDTGRVNLVFDD